MTQYSPEQLGSIVRLVADRLENMSAWESEFIDSMLRIRGGFTPKQRDVIVRLYDKLPDHLKAIKVKPTFKQAEKSILPEGDDLVISRFWVDRMAAKQADITHPTDEDRAERSAIRSMRRLFDSYEEMAQADGYPGVDMSPEGERVMAQQALVIGNVYDMKHSRKGDATVKVLHIDGEWVDVEVVEGDLTGIQEDWIPGEVLRVRESLARFTANNGPLA